VRTVRDVHDRYRRYHEIHQYLDLGRRATWSLTMPMDCVPCLTANVAAGKVGKGVLNQGHRLLSRVKV
jgi:hypothetical protein